MPRWMPQSPLAGYAPGGAVTFLLRNRCVTIDASPQLFAPLRWRYGEPAVLVDCGVWLNSLRSNNASPDPHSTAFLGANRWGPGSGIGPAAPGIAPRARVPPPRPSPEEGGRNTGRSPRCVRAFPALRLPPPGEGWDGGLRPRRNGAQAPDPAPRGPPLDAPRSAACGGPGLALFERSEFSQTPP